MRSKSFFLIGAICLVFTACQKAPKMSDKNHDESKTPGETIPGLPETTSVESFKSNLYEPILEPYCQECHSGTFADSNLDAAHQKFLSRVAFDKFTGVEQTPVVLKMKQSHNCWEGENKKCVDTVSQAIDRWLLDLTSAGFEPSPPS